ncbi:hypothetical protein [Catellatospora sichuanensis]|uniref:hypothetical protein n=1 Tax=Catellatospora sichuanensis TaxID=1969805 RepID=UPI001182648A|nr:hypothetical protein [Catellatospora sichuanensis]
MTEVLGPSQRKLALALMTLLPFMVFFGEFVTLLFTYWLLAPIAPAGLSEVAANIGKWALLVAILKIPFAVDWLQAMRHMQRFSVSGEFPPAERGNAHRGGPALRAVLDVVATAVASLVTFAFIARLPFTSDLLLLIVVSAGASYLLPASVGWLFSLLRWLGRALFGPLRRLDRAFDEVDRQTRPDAAPGAPMEYPSPPEPWRPPTELTSLSGFVPSAWESARSTSPTSARLVDLGPERPGWSSFARHVAREWPTDDPLYKRRHG